LTPSDGTSDMLLGLHVAICGDGCHVCHRVLSSAPAVPLLIFSLV
jgi:hypothetical protein